MKRSKIFAQTSSQLSTNSHTNKALTKCIGKNMNKKFMFVLKNVNTENVDQRYGISIVSNIINEENAPKNTTKISDLTLSKNIPEIVSFVDESKKTHKCTVSMVDFQSKKDFCQSFLHDCFWCRNPIPDKVLAIGCPIKYIPTQAVKSYYSEISKDKYTIKQNITTKHQQILEKNGSNVGILNKNYYLTDGIFCSFNCCMAYIEDNKHKSMYSMSHLLLLKMYHDIYPDKIQNIDAAPHWRKLKQYGGDLTIEQFRDSFNKIEYKEYGFISKIPKFQPVGLLFEEKLKL